MLICRRWSTRSALAIVSTVWSPPRRVVRSRSRHSSRRRVSTADGTSPSLDILRIRKFGRSRFGRLPLQQSANLFEFAGDLFQAIGNLLQLEFGLRPFLVMNERQPFVLG